MIIGIMGARGAGKDTVADVLVEEFGYTKVAFADPLREIAAAIDPVVGVSGYAHMIYYNDAVASLGYTEAKETYPELRRFLQRLGTEAGRQVLGEDFWVDQFLEKVSRLGTDKIVATDCRFPNEVDTVRQMNGRIWTVVREGHDPNDEHASERYWREIDPNLYLYNQYDLEEFKDVVRQVARSLDGNEGR